MSQVRFQVLYGPASLHPTQMGWPAPDDLAATPQDWYGWRLVSANNRELGRSARSYTSYPVARTAILSVRARADHLAGACLADRATGRWTWRMELDDGPVAASSRWYEREHDSKLAMAKFVKLLADAELAEGLVTLRDRRGPAASTYNGERTS